MPLASRTLMYNRQGETPPPAGFAWSTYAHNLGYSSFRNGGLCWSEDLAIFLCVSSSGVATSADGITWVARTDPSPTTGWHSAIWVPAPVGLFVMAGAGANNTDCLATSPDGDTWTMRTGPGPASANYYSQLAYSPADGLIVAVNWDQFSPDYDCITSPDGINWTGRTGTQAPPSGYYYGGITYSPDLDLFLAQGVRSGFNKRMTSSDGITWAQTAGATHDFQDAGYFVWAGGTIQKFVRTEGDGLDAGYSADGINWTYVSTPGGQSVLNVVYDSAADRVYGVINASTFVYTDDGITWFEIAFTGTAPSTFNCLNIIYAPALNIFLSVLFDGTMYRGVPA